MAASVTTLKSTPMPTPSTTVEEETSNEAAIAVESEIGVPTWRFH